MGTPEPNYNAYKISEAITRNISFIVTSPHVV